MSTDPDKRLHSLEWRVLLAAAREAPAPQLAGVLLEAASEVLHPERFVAHCLSTKTYPLAQSALRDARAFEHNTRFGPALSALRQKTFQAWLPRRSRLCSTQRKLHEGLDSAAVPHVFLRGPRFAERYYRQPELRVSDDLDLLVRREDLSRTALVLRELGFTHEQDQQVRVAKALYQGQITWRRTQDGTLLDLNWRLTANAGVGPVEQDLDEAWARAISVSNHEYVLAPEDELLYLLRHLSHGHDFARGIVRGCADLEAFFSHHTFLDFDYFRAQAQRAESLRAIAFVLHFFTHEFVSSQPLPPVLEQLLAVHEQEARCFSRAVIWPLMQLREHNRPTALLVRRNWGLFAKAWAVDSPARVRWLWRVILRPTPEERLLITGHAAPATLRAHAAWFSHMLFMAPGLVLGMLARLIMPLSDKAGRRVAVNTREAPHELL